jgi:dihydropteroate synthase
VLWALDHGASMVRVHDVAPAVEAVRLLAAMAAADPGAAAQGEAAQGEAAW